MLYMSCVVFLHICCVFFAVLRVCSLFLFYIIINNYIFVTIKLLFSLSVDMNLHVGCISSHGMHPSTTIAVTLQLESMFLQSMASMHHRTYAVPSLSQQLMACM